SSAPRRAGCAWDQQRLDGPFGRHRRQIDEEKQDRERRGVLKDGSGELAVPRVRLSAQIVNRDCREARTRTAQSTAYRALRQGPSANGIRASHQRPQRTSEVAMESNKLGTVDIQTLEQPELVIDGATALAPDEEITREQRRSRRKRDVRARTISVKRMTKRELEIGKLLYPETDYFKPKQRAECAEGPRPCPYVSCKHHLFIDVSPRTGAIKLNFPDLEVWELGESCALDVADRGGTTLEDVGAIMNLTRERIRQVEVKALAKLEALRDMSFLRDFVDEGPVGKRRLPRLSKQDLKGPGYREAPEDDDEIEEALDKADALEAGDIPTLDDAAVLDA